MASRLDILKAKYPSETKVITIKDYIGVNNIEFGILGNPEIRELYDLLNAQGLAVINVDGSPKKKWYNPFGGNKKSRKSRVTRKRRRHTKKHRYTKV